MDNLNSLIKTNHKDTNCKNDQMWISKVNNDGENATLTLDETVRAVETTHPLKPTNNTSSNNENLVPCPVADQIA